MQEEPVLDVHVENAFSPMKYVLDSFYEQQKQRNVPCVARIVLSNEAAKCCYHVESFLFVPYNLVYAERLRPLCTASYHLQDLHNMQKVAAILLRNSREPEVHKVFHFAQTRRPCTSILSRRPTITLGFICSTTRFEELLRPPT